MTAELRRGLMLAGVGLAGGFALVVALFGPGELMKRASSVVTPTEAPRTLAHDPGRADAGRSQTPSAESGTRADRGSAAPSPQAGLYRYGFETLPEIGSAEKPAGADSLRSEDSKAPSLDIVRVEPNGDAVIAGRTTPNASVEILRDNKPVARVTADPSGQFAIIPPTLPTGNSELSYRSVSPDGKETRGKESVAVVVAENRTTKPLVAVSTPDKPTVVVSQPDAPSGESADETIAEAKNAPDGKVAEKSADKPPQRLSALGEPTASARAALVRIVSIDAQEGGRLDVTGSAKPGVPLRLYLNDTLVAAGKAGTDGRLTFTIGRGVTAGGYQVRVDQVEPGSGKVEHRAQVAFAFPEAAAAKVAGREALPASAVPPPIPGKPEPGKKPLGDLASRDRSPAENAVSAGTAQPPAAMVQPGGSVSPENTEPRALPETPSVAAAGRKPGAPAMPIPGTGKRTAEALAPKLPPAGETMKTDTPSQGGTAFAAPKSRLTEPKVPESAGTVFVPEISTAKITRGDNLWQISRRSYGNGMRYTVIFDANKEQIKDPHLIYPGQIFVLPKDEGGAKRG